MLRITTCHAASGFVLKLEGWLTGAFVHELETSWRTATDGSSSRRICVDLREVYYVDDRGRELLTQMYRAGVNFVAKGCEMPELVREISETTEVAPRS